MLAAYPGATSEQVEKQVTQKLEEHIFKFPEVRKQKTYSTSRPGLVFIKVELEDNVKDARPFWAKLRHEMNETAPWNCPRGVHRTVGQLRFRRHGGHAGRHSRPALRISRTPRLRGPHQGRTAHRPQRGQAGHLRRADRGDPHHQQSGPAVAIFRRSSARHAVALQQRNIIQSSGSLDAGTAKSSLAHHRTLHHRRPDPQRAGGCFANRAAGLYPRLRRCGAPLSGPGRSSSATTASRACCCPIEMQKGKNIVQLGDQLSARLRQSCGPFCLRTSIVDLVANQPAVVKDRMPASGTSSCWPSAR